MKRTFTGIAVAVGASAIMVAGTAGVTNASIAHPTVVNEDAVSYTPELAADAVQDRPIAYAINQLGDTIYTGGRFHSVQNSSRTQTFERHNLFSFNATTGAINSFAPDVDNDVWAVETAGNSIYIGGEFTTVNGVSRPAIAKLDPTTGAVDTAFDPAISHGRVTEIHLVGGRLLVSGTFQSRLVALDPTTGKNTGYINIPITGTVPVSTTPGQVFKFSVNPAGTRLVAVGNFTSVGGEVRQRAFMLNLGASSASLSSWYYPPLNTKCASNTGNRVAQLTDVDFSPDGSYFVFVSTGFVPAQTSQIGTAICDAAARFETDILSPTAPKWINYTGGDTLHSVAVTGAAVYVQGHSRWLDNPLGRDSAGPGAVVRWGGGAIDPTTGKANSWDPIMKHATGGYDFYASPTGLWIASDGKFFNTKHHYGIAFCALP
jgi:hypothetical protein